MKRYLAGIVTGILLALPVAYALDQFIYGNTHGAREFWCAPLVDSSNDFLTASPGFAAGDAKWSNDWDGTWTATTNTMVWVGNGWACVELTQAELQNRILAVNFIDQTTAKAWRDTAILGFSGGNIAGSYYNRINGLVNVTD